jgi:hypothetical protein
MGLHNSWMHFFNDVETKKEFMELLKPVKESLYNEIYLYIWIICFYSIMLFLLILANLFLLLRILNQPIQINKDII